MKKYFFKIHQNPLKWSGSNEQHFFKRRKKQGGVDNLASVENKVSHYTSKNRHTKLGCQCGEST